jgi:hypothetical protein
MGRLIEPVSNGRARLMIELSPRKTGKIQNPAYRFAAAHTPFPVKRKGFFN